MSNRVAFEWWGKVEDPIMEGEIEWNGWDIWGDDAL